MKMEESFSSRVENTVGERGEIADHLAPYQMTDFRLFQTDRVYRRPFHI